MTPPLIAPPDHRRDHDPHRPYGRDDGRTSGLAVTALVLCLCGIHLLVPFFAVPALRRIRRRGESGRGMALVALWISGVWLATVTLAVLSLPWLLPVLTDPGRLPDTGERAVSQLRQGDCFSGAPSWWLPWAPARVEVVACEAPHEAEVYSVFEVTGSRLHHPRTDLLASDADRACRERFADFVGRPVEGSTLGAGAISPDLSTWTLLDDQEVACVVLDPAGPTTGTLEGALR